MSKLNFKGRLALLIALSTWIYFLLFVPTFDFDESLYRRVAEGMKTIRNPWSLAWDGDPLYHKPPIFYWCICLWSFLIDGSAAIISSISSRLPSITSSIGILFYLYFGTRSLTEDRNTRAPWIAVLAFCTGAFPLLTAAGVVFDPMQTLALMPSLFIPTRFFINPKPIQKNEWILWSLGLFLACAIKGLNGIIIPTFAFGIHLLFQIKEWGLSATLKIALRFFAFAFLPASLLTTAFYFLLDQKIGRPFTHEFLWVQHFERSQNAMEQHSGSILYHPMILFLGGGFLTPLWLYTFYRKPISFKKYGFPLTFAFAFIFIFSFSATKLPHYTWPIWPAIALFLALLSLAAEKETREVNRRVGFLLSVPVFLLGVCLLLLATMPTFFIESLPNVPMVRSLLSSFPGFSFLQKLLFYLGALICFVFQIRRRDLTRSVETTSLFAVTVSFILILGLAPTAKDLFIKPFEEMSTVLKNLMPKPTDCIRYSGALSPTFGLALGRELVHNRCEPGNVKFLVTPEWKANECKDRNLTVVDQKSYLILCIRK